MNETVICRRHQTQPQTFEAEANEGLEEKRLKEERAAKRAAEEAERRLTEDRLRQQDFMLQHVAACSTRGVRSTQGALYAGLLHEGWS